MVAVKDRAVIDADFFNKITNEGSDASLFIAVMNELELEPIMHSYVYSYELGANTAARSLVNEGYITIEDENQFWTSNEASYQRSFLMLYQKMNGKSYSGVTDVRDYHHSGENLGEIRSSLLNVINLRTYLCSEK